MPRDRGHVDRPTKDGPPSGAITLCVLVGGGLLGMLVGGVLWTAFTGARSPYHFGPYLGIGLVVGFGAALLALRAMGGFRARR